MPSAADDALDLDQVTYFRARYSRLDEEELTELAGRRDTLADEAAAALDDVLRTRGISVAAIAAANTPPPETPVEQQITLAKDLWAGAASKTGQFLCTLAFLGLAGLLVKLVPHFGTSPGQASFGAVVAGLVVLAMGYGGYRFGRYCTREICADGDKPIEQRRRELRWFAAAVVLLYVLLYWLLGTVLPRQ